jgi:hypothetical protein
MHEIVMWNQIEQTPHEVLSSLKGVTGVDTTTRTHDLGKFNLSYTVDSYVDTVKWLDSKLTSLFADTTDDQTLADTTFPIPVRMSRGPARRRNTTNKPKISAYTQHRRTKYPTTVGTPPPPAPNVWQNRSRQAFNFNYSVEHFPTLIPPIQPPAVSVDSSSPTQPLSQTSTMTDAETQAYIATCICTEHAKLVITTTQLSTDIGNMRQEFHTMIETTHTQHTVQIKKFISDAVRDTTSHMTASATAPYATKSEFNDMFSGFKEEFCLLLQGTHALSTPPASSSMQYQPMGPNGPLYGYGVFPPSATVQR